jgi:hypothetical protein
MPKPVGHSDGLSCSFCGKTQAQVVKLIAGPGVYICDQCVNLCTDIIEEELGHPGHADGEGQDGGAGADPTDDDIEAAARAVNEAVSRFRVLALRRRAAPPATDPQ